jgi:hypothetical protein
MGSPTANRNDSTEKKRADSALAGNHEIAKYKELCARAADALEMCHTTHQTGYGWLIAELRKAAE